MIPVPPNRRPRPAARPGSTSSLPVRGSWVAVPDVVVAPVEAVPDVDPDVDVTESELTVVGPTEDPDVSANAGEAVSSKAPPTTTPAAICRIISNPPYIRTRVVLW
jgi:hypothetical protein